MRENIVVLDFGGQYNQLIARRVRECNVYCEVHPYTISMDELKELAPSGIILTGGPNSVYGDDSPQCSPELFKLEFRCWAFAMVRSFLLTSLAAELQPHR